jgi:hypothetical protein
MNISGVLTCAVALALLTSAAPAGTEPVGPGPDQDAAQFLLTSIRVKNALARGSTADNRLGEDFWQLATSFVSAATDDREDEALYAPLFRSMDSTLQDDALAGPAVKTAAVARVRETLTDEMKLLKGWGWAPGQRRGIAVEVNAIDGAKHQIGGLYVWFDLACCVRPDRSSNIFQSTTSPAVARVIPGTYFVRLLRGDRVVAHREVAVGGTGSAQERIDVVVE